MGYENDPNRDENGEPLMDFDGMISDQGVPLTPVHESDCEEFKDMPMEELPLTPVHESDCEEFKDMPMEKLMKSNAKENDEFSLLKRKKGSKEGGGGWGKLKKHKADGGIFDKGSQLRTKNGSSGLSKDHISDDPEMKTFWDTIAGADLEKDIKTEANDSFIDDSGLEPAHRHVSDKGAGPAVNAPKAKEDDEINQLFKLGRKKKKYERTSAEIALLVEEYMAELEVQAEEDAILNRQSMPAINKLKKLPFLTEVLSKKQLQLEFLDHGVLSLLKTWLEPLPDGSLPNINIRSAILNILTEFPLDLEQYNRRDQLKKSGLGKVIMFLSKSDEETMANKRLAKDLVDKWSRPIFNRSTRFERNSDDERVPYQRPSVKKLVNQLIKLEPEDALDLAISQVSQSAWPSSRQHASRPEALALDFLMRPSSRINPNEIRERAKKNVQGQRRMKMNKKLQNLKASKKKQLQATKLSAEGRGMVKFL